MTSSKQTSFDLSLLPIGVAEQIFCLLDGPSVIALRKISPHMEAYVDEVFTGKIGRKYWMEQCFYELRRVQVTRAIASFATNIEPHSRRLPVGINDSLVSRFGCKWREIYISLHDLTRTFTRQLEVTRFTRVQNWIKNEVAIMFEDDTAKANYPVKLASTSGSILFHIQTPCSSLYDQEHVYVFEEMSTYRRGMQVVGGRDKVQTMIAVNLPFEKNSSELNDALLPKSRVLLIITTNKYIVVAPLHQGEIFRISIVLPRRYRNYPTLSGEKRYAIWGDKLGVWINPDLIAIFQIQMDPITGNVNGKIIKKVNLNNELQHVWLVTSVEPNSYLPALRRKFQNPYTAKASDIPVFCLLSPTTLSYEIHYGDLNHETEETTARFEIFEPKTTPIHNTSSILQLGDFRGCKAEQNMAIFWNHNWLVILYSNGIWIYENLTSSLFSDSADEKLLLVECQTENLFLLNSNYNIYISILRFIPPSCVNIGYNSPGVWARGRIEFDVIRKISLATFLPNPALIVTHLHCDLDRGRPYIFLTADFPEAKRTAFSYEFIKLEFEQSIEELDQQFGHLMLDDTWTLNTEDVDFSGTNHSNANTH